MTNFDHPICNSCKFYISLNKYCFHFNKYLDPDFYCKNHSFNEDLVKYVKPITSKEIHKEVKDRLTKLLKRQ